MSTDLFRRTGTVILSLVALMEYDFEMEDVLFHH